MSTNQEKIESLRNDKQQEFYKRLIDNITLATKKDGTLKPEGTINNCVFILENEPFLKDTIKFNEMSNQIEKIILDEQGNYKIEQWSDTDDKALRQYFEIYDMKNTRSLLNDAVPLVAHNNRYHPVKEYFKTLQWDNVPRIDTLLHKLFKVENNIYHSEALRIFMTGAVERIYSPGCKFDYMLIIKGEQGIKKSTFFKILAVNPEWYLEDLRSVDKAGIEQIQGKWIVEWGELNAMSKEKDIANVKMFITITHDTVRFAYDKYPSTLPRQCVFGGTTNEPHFLYDKTGNRRFLPIVSSIPSGEAIDTEYLSSVVDQLWAEALELYKKVYPHVLSKEAQEIASNAQKEATEEDVNIGLVQAYLEDCIAGTEVCSKMIWEKAIKSSRDMKTSDSTNIIRIMNNTVGWNKYTGSKDGRKKLPEYGYQYCWIKN